MGYLLISYIYLTILLLGAVCSLVIHFRKDVPAYLKYFTPFLIATFLVETAGLVMNLNNQNASLLYNLFTITEVIFYFIIFYQITRNRTVRRMIIYLICLYPPVALTNVFFFQGPDKFHHFTYLPGAVIIVGLCAWYFHELMKLPVFPNPGREPTFWICCELLFFYSTTLPLFAAFHFAYDLSPDELYLLGFVQQIPNYIMYSLFIIAFLCKPRMEETT